MNDQKEKCRAIGDFFDFMPLSSGVNHQSDCPKLFLKHEIKNSVTFFGGSFHPFHQGHRECLDQCPEENIVIIMDRNPFKPLNENENIFDEAMALAEKLKETPYSLYPGFLALDNVNPTSSWLPSVKIKEKNFLMGDDSFMALHKWNDPEKLIKSLTKLYVVPRLHTEVDYLAQEQLLKKMNPDLDVIYLADHPYKNLSSSQLRK